MYLSLSLLIFLSLSIYIYIRIYPYVCIYIYTHTHIHMYVHIVIEIHMRMCIYTHTFLENTHTCRFTCRYRHTPWFWLAMLILVWLVILGPDGIGLAPWVLGPKAPCCQQLRRIGVFMLVVGWKGRLERRVQMGSADWRYGR